MPHKNSTEPHFQNFKDLSNSEEIAPRMQALREAMVSAGVDVFLVPRADAHRGESVPARDARLAWLTGFTGSAGMAAIGSEKAALFVDSRYVLQAPRQTDTNLFEIVEVPGASVSGWINENISNDAVVGFDPWLHTASEISKLREKIGTSLKLVPCANLIDQIWTNQPGSPISEVEFLGQNRSGKTSADKISDLQERLVAADCSALILTLPESICWLFNMRGRDVPNTPFVLAYAIVTASGLPTIFLEEDKLTDAVRAALDGIATPHEKSTFPESLKELGLTKETVWLDAGSAPSAVAEILAGAGATLHKKPDPILAIKAVKNQVELSGMREAHQRDGVAMAKFLCWFDDTVGTTPLTEIDLVAKLESFRREDDSLVDISFDTISGAGPNGAIVHYRVTENTNRELKPGELMLVDSGGQYLSGTTDITRTLYSGDASDAQKENYTRVLKGMIAISMVKFPKGTNGAQIDILARQYLWQVGRTYNHGTGHGVGAFLGVHEGPIGISSRYNKPFEPGHIVSNEPGYYEEDAYGIRIENLVHVTISEIGDNFFEFETLTLTPIETRLIDKSLMSDAEINWLNAYHARVLSEIGPQLDEKESSWLRQATQGI